MVFPRLRTDGLKWSFTGETEARQVLLSRGVTALLADPNMGGTDESSALEGSMLSRAIAYVGTMLNFLSLLVMFKLALAEATCSTITS